MKNEVNYLECFGEKACKAMVWKAIPLQIRLLSFPLGVTSWARMAKDM